MERDGGGGVFLTIGNFGDELLEEAIDGIEKLSLSGEEEKSDTAGDALNFLLDDGEGDLGTWDFRRSEDDDFFVDATAFGTCFGEGFATTELGEFEKEVLFMTL